MKLTDKTVKELRELAKEHGIVGRWDMNKEQLIIALTTNTEVQNVLDNKNINENIQNVPEGSQKVTKTTDDYLANIEPGTLVAFKRKKDVDIAMSGKYVSFENEKVIIETKQGTMFKVDPQNIVWVKTGARWPKWVFAMFNNNKESGVSDDNALS